MWFASPGPGRRRMQPIRATTPWAAAHPRLIAAAPGWFRVEPVGPDLRASSSLVDRYW